MKRRVKSAKSKPKPPGKHRNATHPSKSKKNLRHHDLLADDVYSYEDLQYLNKNDPDYHDLFI